MSTRTFPELADLFASTLRIKRTIVASVIRSLREAGELERGKTGLGAPTVDGEAAAKVLMTLLATERPRDAVETARAYYGLVDGGGNRLLAVLGALFEGETPPTKEGVPLRGGDIGLQPPSNDELDNSFSAWITFLDADDEEHVFDFFETSNAEPEFAADPNVAVISRTIECGSTVISIISRFLAGEDPRPIGADNLRVKLKRVRDE